MCDDRPSIVYDPALDEVDKAEMWLGLLLRDYQDGKVPVKNQRHLFGSWREIHKLLLKYRSK